MAVPAVITILEAEARFHRERLALYRARRYGSRPTSEARFRELTRASRRADEDLRRARADARAEEAQQ
jgi:hypothetical protein